MNLCIEIPTKDEIEEEVEKQKIDFLTTFKKKRGTQLKNTLAKKVKSDSTKANSKAKVAARNVKNSPPEKPKKSKLLGSSKRKKQSQSAMVDINDITDSVTKQIDSIGSSSSGEKKGYLKQKYKIKNDNLKANQLKPTYSRLEGNKSKVKPGMPKRHSEKSKLAPKPTKVPNTNKIRPLSGRNPSRNYAKPWQRPQTASTGTKDKIKPRLESKKVKEEVKKESSRRKASDIMSNRKRLLKPHIEKKTTVDLDRKSVV